jgi:UDP-N-acetylglucosamine--N-acetylmuramyl-(pentapeptide) pyrophosphoryl-undecaprenol N-acetylglucosamine transferase
VLDESAREPSTMTSIVLAGGGTAGHVEPALAVADALTRLEPGITVTLLGTAEGLESRLVPARGYRLLTIPRVPLPRGPDPELLSVPTRLAGAIREAGRALDEVRARVVVGFGGYVALPAYLAARRRRIPIVVHEANAKPGLANRIGAPLAARVLVGFPGTPLRGAEHVGLPLRAALRSLDRGGLRDEARRSLGLDSSRPTVLAFGGSQGASSINRAVPAAAAAIAEAGGQTLLAAGTGRADTARAAAGTPMPPHLVVVDYLDRMDLAYAAADVAVVRAGAMTVAELTAVGLPAVYVPLPIGNGEQRLNAAPVVSAGGGLMIDDALLSADRLAAAVIPLIADPAALAAMGDRASAFGMLDADEAVARVALATLEGRP